MPRQIGDVEDEMLRELRAIRRALGDDPDENSFNAPGRRVLGPGTYVVVETADLDDANADGSITVEPGQRKTLVEFEGSENGGGVGLVAVEATDKTDVTYWVLADNQRVVGGRTNTPLGVINTPFSFHDTLGGIVPAEQTVSYEVRLSASAGAEVDLVGRLHVLDLPAPGGAV